MMRPIFLVLALGACGGAARDSTLRTHQYPDGRLHFQYALRDGLPHGEGVVWHPNGELKSRGDYVNGLKHGLFKFYNFDGEFDRQAYFFKNVKVWESRSPSDAPSTDLLSGLGAFSGGTPRLGEDLGKSYEVEPAPGFRIDTGPPAPLFATLDRTTAMNRFGMQYGLSGGGDMGFASVKRLELFGNYRYSNVGAYGQFSYASLESPSGLSVTARSTLEVGGTYHRALSIGGLSARGGLVVPLMGDDPNGFLAASAASFQRPTDAVTSFASSVAVRTGASLTRSHSRFVLQGDTGVDWVIGGTQPFDALLRANGAVGVGARSMMLSLESSNTIRLSDPSRRLHGLAVGGTFWINKAWAAVHGATTIDGHVTLTGSLGYEL